MSVTTNSTPRAMVTAWANSSQYLRMGIDEQSKRYPDYTRSIRSFWAPGRRQLPKGPTIWVKSRDFKADLSG
jgi:hypothetical protein